MKQAWIEDGRRNGEGPREELALESCGMKRSEARKIVKETVWKGGGRSGEEPAW